MDVLKGKEISNPGHHQRFSLSTRQHPGTCLPTAVGKRDQLRGAIGMRGRTTKIFYRTSPSPCLNMSMSSSERLRAAMRERSAMRKELLKRTLGVTDGTSLAEALGNASTSKQAINKEEEQQPSEERLDKNNTSLQYQGSSKIRQSLLLIFCTWIRICG